MLCRVAAVCSSGAAAIHFGVTGEHFAEWWLYGVFFLAIAAFQVGWAVLIWQRAHPTVLVIGTAVNAATILLWLETRTLGLPFGPDAGHPEAFGVADLACAALELVVVALGVLLVLSGGPAIRVRARTSVVVSVLTAAAVFASCGFALAAPGEGHDAGHDDHGSTTAAGTDPSGHDHSGSGGSQGGGSAGHEHQHSTGNGDRHDMSNLPDVSSATAAQAQAAMDLENRTIAATAWYRDIAAATKAGYDLQAALARFQRLHPKRNPAQPIRVLHVANPKLRDDGKLLDPNAPETLLYSQKPDHSWMLVGVMFVAGKGNQPPTTAAPYARWHYHDGCRTVGRNGRNGGQGGGHSGGQNGARKVPANPDGSCPSGSKAFRTGYMMHVWFVPHETPSQLTYAYALEPPMPQLAAYQQSLR